MIDNALQSSPSDQPLATVSVGDFFRQINWHGSPLAGADGLTPSDIQTVGQFFDTFPWHGTATSPSPDDWEPIRDDSIIYRQEDVLTLEDLSALF